MLAKREIAGEEGRGFGFLTMTGPCNQPDRSTILTGRDTAWAERVTVIQVGLNSRFRQLECLAFMAERHLLLAGSGSGFL